MPNPPAERIAMFRDASHWTGWRQFHSAEHEQNTREDGGYEVRDFVPVDSSLRSAIEQEIARLRAESDKHPELIHWEWEADRLQAILNEQGGGSDD